MIRRSTFSEIRVEGIGTVETVFFVSADSRLAERFSPLLFAIRNRARKSVTVARAQEKKAVLSTRPNRQPKDYPPPNTH